MNSVEAVEKILNYSFTNKTLLKEAITQKSPLFDRLEFFGDSVLAVAFTNYIRHTYPNLKVKELRDLRTANVSNEKFARVAVNHNLHHFLLHQNPSLFKKVKEFAEAVRKEDGPVPYGGLVKAPKVLADIVESIAGAVFIDVDFDVQRLWEESFGANIYTGGFTDAIETAISYAFRLVDKHGKRIDFRYSKDDDSKQHIAEVYLDDIFIASGCAKRIDTAKLFAAEEAIRKLEIMPIEKIINEDSPHVEPEDVKGKSFVICNTENLQLQTELSSLSTASENSLADEMTQEEMVIDEDSSDVEPEDVKGKLFEICYTRKLQIQTGSSANPLTYEMTTKQMVVDKDSLHVEPTDGRGKLIEICTKNKWPRPIFSVEEERGPKNEQKFVCSVKIEIPIIEGTFHMKGDAKPKKKQAENSSAYHMIRALESSLMSLVISNLQMPESLDTKKNPSMDSDSVEKVEAVQKILNYSFVSKNLLKEVLMHNNSLLFQRLMFVGEPALSLAFTKHLYLTYPKLEPKDLSLLRDANTCNDRYARVAVKKGIYQFIIGNVPKPEKMVIEFIDLMRKEDDPYRVVKAPKILANLVVAVAGAVYIDVNYNVQRLWEIFRGLFAPIYTPDDIWMQPKPPILALFHLADKHEKRIDFRYSKYDGSRKNVVDVYLDDIFIASGCAKRIDTAKLLAAEEALKKLSECMLIEKIIHQDHLDAVVQTGSSSLLTASKNPLTDEMTQEQMVIDEDSLDVEQKLFEIRYTKELQIQTGSSSLPTVSENPLPCEITPTKMVIGEVSPHVEPEDVKGKSFEISSTETSSLPIAFENPLTDELTQEQMVIDENSPYVEPVDAKGKLFEISSTRKLQTLSGSSSLPTASENLSTDELTQEQMVINENSPHVEPDDVKGKSFEISSSETSSLPIVFENPLTDELRQEQMVIDENSPYVEPVDAKGKLFELCSTRKLQTQTGSSSLPIDSENLSTDELTQEQMVIDENCPHVEPEDEKGKSFEISSSETSSLPIVFENPLTDELRQEQMVIDENSPYVEPVDAKGKLFELCSTRKLQTQTGSSSLPIDSENLSTDELTQEQMVIDENCPHVEPEDEKGKLFEICTKNKWPNPIFSVEEERGQQNEQKFVCTVKIEIPSIEGTFYMKGDAESTKKEAENSSANHMIRALESSIMSLVISNLQMPRSLDEKKKNLQMQESLDENKNLHSKKRRTI